MTYTQFIDGVFKLTALDLASYKEAQMKRRIDTNIKKHNCKDYADYLSLLSRDKAALNKFLSYVTINVSEFFRNPTQWQTLEKSILPEMIQSGKTLTVWSAACSTGDEPYSLAMMLSAHLPTNRFKIIATDLDVEILAKARMGVYPEKQILNLPHGYRDKYFKKNGNLYHISQEIKQCIEFKQHNLLKDAYPKNVDIIVCRNVLIYFTEEAKDSIYHKFSQSLAPNGVLFVGSTEQIITPQQYRFDPCKIFFYKKK
ncbi:MAG: chemotaxis protein CheR [Epulopiscium sp. Nele67-Bin005]|nr:MAG: chemotaxis protein CheR [Epulopiscium sp. Nele67-Bin005]